MENTALTIVQQNEPTYDFEQVSKDFIAFVQQECTHPETKHFYSQTASELLLNIQSVIAQNPNSINVLSNEQLMTVVGRFLGREDFLDSAGSFNPKSIFAFAKEEYGVDLLGSIPVMFRGAVMSAIGL